MNKYNMVQEIISQIRVDLDEKDCAQLIRAIHVMLSDTQRLVEPPSIRQEKVLYELLIAADNVETFYK